MSERGYYWTDAPNGEYEILFRPDGTEVTTITEPEDRISLRDLAPVCVELNTLQTENARLREQADSLAMVLTLIAEGECAMAYGHGDEECAPAQARTVLRAYREANRE